MSLCFRHEERRLVGALLERSLSHQEAQSHVMNMFTVASPNQENQRKEWM